LSQEYRVPVEPLRLDLPGSRSAIFQPGGKDFPDKATFEFCGNRPDGTKGTIQRFKEFNMSGTNAALLLEQRLMVSQADATTTLSKYWEWAPGAKKSLEEDAARAVVPVRTPYGLTQRQKLTPRAQAYTYPAIDSPIGFMEVLNKSRLPDDTLLEWSKDTLDHLACLDLDFHAIAPDQRPTADQLDELARGLSPGPFAWWRTQGHGLHAMYAPIKDEPYTAQELLSCAAAELISDPFIALRRGTVEIKAATRHPGALQNGKPCGPLHAPIQTLDFAFLGRLSHAESTAAEVEEIKEHYGLVEGMRLDHSYCLIDPGHPSAGQPVVVMSDGLFCHSCAGRTGRGFMSWGFARRVHGLAPEGQRSLLPLQEAAAFFTHVGHADYLFEQLIPELPEVFRHHLYRLHMKAKNPGDPRIPLAFSKFNFVRGPDCWLHKDTLLPVGRPLNAKDVSVLPSCLVPDLDGEMHLVQIAVTTHTNNGRIDGWVPLAPYRFEPIHFVHNEAKDVAGQVRCYPRRPTTKARVTYVLPQNRIPLDEAERRIEEYFPGINMQYVKALIVAAGSGESERGDIPVLWATGLTESAKTTTIRIVLEMYGEAFVSMSKITDDRLDQVFGESLDRTRLAVFDDFAKLPENHEIIRAFILQINRSGHTYHKLHHGARTVPANTAIILTDLQLPPFFTQDQQFSRRVHLIRLGNRLQKGWLEQGRFVEGWWQSSPELTAAAQSLHSYLVDEYFPEGHNEPFETKMKRMGINKLESEIDQGEDREVLRDIVRKLVRAIGDANSASEETEKRLGRGIQQIFWGSSGAIGKECTSLCDSMGKDKGTIDTLRHILEPFQLEMGKLFHLAEGVARVEFELKIWGQYTYIRMVEGMKTKKGQVKKVNKELFTSWPPMPIAPPVAAEPSLPVEGDTEPVVILEDHEMSALEPFVVYLDFETQSECDLKKHGSYIYAEHPSTKIVCAAMQVEGQRIFWTEEPHNLTMPEGTRYEHGREFLRAMVTDPSGCIIVAHSMEFERAIWTRVLKLPEPQQWYDTMDITLSKGMPAGADKAGEYLLGLRKDVEGYKHMMSTCKPKKVRDHGMMMPPIDDICIQKMLLYNFRDVDISKGIADRFGIQMQPPWEQKVCDFHHKVNFYGVKIDKEYCQTLQIFDEELKEEAGRRVEQITGGSITRTDLLRRDFMLDAVNTNLPKHRQLSSLRQEVIDKLLDKYRDDPEVQDDVDPSVIEVLKCRLIVSRAALAKVEKALNCISADGRAKAQFQYHAAHTGRAGGRGIQLQNLARPDESFDIQQAITAIETKNRDLFAGLCKGKPPYELLSSLVRGILIPEPGKVFVSADFASIEARVLAWLADDEDALNEHRDADRGGPDVYCRLATTLFGREITKKDKTPRQAGKIGHLACGFSGGVNAVNRFTATYGLDFAAIGVDPQQIVDAFRERYPRIKALWYDYDAAFRRIISSTRFGGDSLYAGKCLFKKYDDRVEITLPSGRALTYMNARLIQDSRSFSRDGRTLVYDTAVKGQVKVNKVYGGLLSENITQATARDLLFHGALKVDAAGYDIALHVHDELLVEVSEDKADACSSFVKQALETNPDWGQGIPLFADPSTARRYGK
jgi:DNA polymerase bacteriophage-type